MKYIIYKCSDDGIKRIYDCQTKKRVKEVTKTMSGVIVTDPDGNAIAAVRI